MSPDFLSPDFPQISKVAHHLNIPPVPKFVSQGVFFTPIPFLAAGPLMRGRLVSMTREDLRLLLGVRADSDFVEHEILGRRPWIFAADEPYRRWRESVGSSLGLARESVWIVGSAATGYSLSPYKPGRPFRALGGPEETTAETSDIDIAIVAPELFLLAWETILSFDRKRLLGGAEYRGKIRLDVYWGLVGSKTIPRNTGPARSVMTAMAAAGRIPPIRGYPLTCRIYRRLEDLRAYHENSLRSLRTELPN